MANEPPHPIPGVGPLPERLVTSTRPKARRDLEVSGWILVFLGLFFGANGLAFIALYVMPMDWSDPLWRVVESPSEVGLASLDLTCLFGMSLYLAVMGVLILGDGWQLRRFRLLLDHRGLAADGRPGVVPWERVRHVMVTKGNPGWRRLLIDDGTAPAWWWLEPGVRPGRALLSQFLGRRALVVNVPVGRFDVAEAEILRAIHHYSDGRFPNDPLPRWRRAGP